MDPYDCVIVEIHEEDILMDLIIIRRSARKQISVYKLKRGSASRCRFNE